VANGIEASSLQMDIVPLKMFPSFCVALFLGLAFRAYAKVFTGYVVGITDSDTIAVPNADYRHGKIARLPAAI
jgi:hypothetical protein